MNLDKWLEEFKETADRTLLRGMEDTTGLEERIRMNIEKKGKKRFRFIYPVSAALVAVALVIGFTPYLICKRKARRARIRLRERLPSQGPIKSPIQRLTLLLMIR